MVRVAGNGAWVDMVGKGGVHGKRHGGSGVAPPAITGPFPNP